MNAQDFFSADYISSFELIQIRQFCLEQALRLGYQGTQTVAYAMEYENYITRNIPVLSAVETKPESLDEAVAEVLETEEADPTINIDLDTEDFKDEETFSNDGVFLEKDSGKTDNQ